MSQGQDEEYGPGSPDYGLSYAPDPSAVADYGPGSPDYGLSYESDPWVETAPDEHPERSFRESDFGADDAESMWEAAFRDGHITREQFQNRRRVEPAPAREEAPDAGPVIRSAVEKLRAKLTDPGLSSEQRALDERALASLEEMLDKKQTGPDGPPDVS
ncbi:hypothetical protein [Streptomyces sp. H39-C1]|uniref:hypothetical protein n=1 Tax=Streptomyces sp. H39-C1 TaxID=3004355 RepID=UPI0022AE82DD|nr:hypothetical protein [Streptomyces sp. H39-C1]MCZ4098005.1 hypothetical protein [Streptomyces sp. H39-C1]